MANVMYVKGKVALITGGAIGLGFVFAKELLKNGLKGVTLVDVNEGKGKEAANTLTDEFGENKVIFLKVDVVNMEELEDAMIKTVEFFGHFDILINNAGIMTDNIWEREVDINIKGLFNGCLLGFEKYLPKYKSCPEPVIINIASSAALSPLYFMPIYTGTKHAVVGISKTLALPENYESQKVRILTVCPGATCTTLIDNLETRSFTPRHADGLKNFFENYPHETRQTPEEMAEGLIKIIENGDNGSVWVVQGGKTYQVELPSHHDLKVLKRL